MGVGVHIVFDQVLATYLLVVARLAGVVVTAPVLASSFVPRLAKVGLAVILAAALTASLPPVAVANLLALALGLVLQFVVGLLMGLVLALFLAAFSMAGQLVTYQLGVGLAVAANPGLLSAGSFLAEWETLLATFVFVVSGGLELTAEALRASFVALPLTAGGLPVGGLPFVVGLFGTVVNIALLVGAPFLATGVVVDLAVGVLARAVPQLNAYFLALPVNFGLSLLVLAAVLPLWLQIVPTVWHHAFEALSHLLALWEVRP
ncbi:MAG: flagellar biosynthetic protein FliR [Firmicutes bacterium]|nr:flagellar biosynthetic protein FliR [Alicyclobacillaceae bacterium]MCL6497306.1 flagellar biosynthetic protein FliR [Bacillota bacterium]